MEKIINNYVGKIVQIKKVKDNQLELAYLVIKTLKFFQSWPLGYSNLKAYVYYLGLLLIYNIPVITMWADIVHCVMGPNLKFSDISKNLGFIAASTGGYQYSIHFFRHRNLVEKLLQKMGDYRVFQKPKGIESTDAFLNAVFALQLGSMVIPGPILFLYYLFQKCDEGSKDDCGLLFPAYLPFSPGSTEKRIFLFIQLICIWSYMILGTAAIWMGLHLAGIIMVYLKHLQDLIKSIPNIPKGKQRQQYLITIIKYHQRILELHGDYCILANGMFVVHAVMTPIMLSVMLHTLFFIEFQIQYCLVLVLYSLIFFVVSFTGQQMINENENLSDIIYETIPWDDDIKSAKILLFMLIRSQQPLQIPAYLTFCGFEFFTTALKTTYSFLTLMETTS